MRLIVPFVMLISLSYGADFTTYVGEAAGAIATDPQGDTYVTGNNAFVTGLDPAGNIVFTRTFGPGGSFSYGYSIAVDPSGNIWVGGQTVAANFPLVNPVQSSVISSGSGFLVKMAPDGTVIYSSYFGGLLGDSAVYGIATDPNGNVYVTGFTEASDFPTTPGLPASPVAGGNAPVYGLFAAKLDPAGQKILYSTVIAGPQNCAFCFPVTEAVGAGIAVDGSGNAFIAGGANTDLPGIAGGSAGPGDFVFEINAAGNSLGYFEFLAVPVTFGARPIAADASGNTYITGYTNSPDFPATPGAYRVTYDAGNNSEAFAVKLNPAGATVWATFLGGQAPPNTASAALSLDSSDNVWLTGTNGEPLFGETSYYVAELSADGSTLPYITQFPSEEAGQDIAIDTSGVVHLAGLMDLVSTITPVEPPAPRALKIVNAATAAFSATVAPGEIISLYGSGLGPETPVTAGPANGFFPTSLGGVKVLVDGAAIPLLYVSDSQINAEIPAPLNGVENGLADVQVVTNTATWPDFRVGVAASDFGVFYSSGAYLAAINQDGTVNSESNPAKAGSYVSLWATGLGNPGAVIDGAVATAASNYCSNCQVSFITYNFRITETVQYAGPSPGLIDGLMQINIMIPAQPQNQAPTPQLQVWFMAPGGLAPMFLGFVWVS